MRNTLLNRKPKFSALFIPLFIALSFYGFSQSNYSFENITPSNGLSYGGVSVIEFDSLGFVWIGTKNGLNRFDGNHFKIYNTANSNLKDNGISDIIRDKNHVLWISTYRGLFKYQSDLDNFQFIKDPTHELDGNSHLQINKLYKDNQDKLWVASESGLYMLANASSSSPELVRMDLKEWNSASILSMEEYEEHLYLGTSEYGLLKYGITKNDIAPATSLIGEVILPKANIKTIHKLNEGLLLGGENIGLQYTDFKVTHSISLEADNFSPRVVSAINKKHDKFWIGTEKGLIVLDSLLEISEIIHKETHSLNSIVGNSITVINTDVQGNVWIGTEYNGISIFNDIQDPVSYYYGDITGNNMYSVISILPMQDKILLGTDGQGLVTLDLTMGTTKTIRSDQAKYLPGDFIKPILRDRNNSFYFGSYLNGLSIMEADSTVKAYSDHFGDIRISSNNISDLVLVKDKLYVGTWDSGLNILDFGTDRIQNRVLNTENSEISHNDISDLEFDGDKTLWIATYGAGLNRIDITTGKLEVVKNDAYGNSLQGENLISLHVCENEKLWIGHWGDGIEYWDFRKDSIVDLSSSLDPQDNIVVSIESDEESNIWFGTKSGIRKYEVSTGRVYKYFKNSPNWSNEYHVNASARDNDGSIYFGGLSGFAKIDPTVKVAAQENGDQVVFTKIEIQGNEIKPGSKMMSNSVPFLEELVLDHYHNVMTIHFSTLLFPSSNGCSYQVMMGNFENEWRDIGSATFATYTNLAPGTYEFKLRSKCLSQNIYNQPKSLQIIILKPWWETNWALTLYFILFTVILFLFSYYSSRWGRLKSKLKTEQLLHQKDNELIELKQNFFTNISHEIRTPLTLIVNSISQLSNRLILDKENRNYFLSITRSANHLTRLVNEVLDFGKLEAEKLELRITYGDFVAFTREIYLSFLTAAEAKGQRMSFHAESETIKVAFDKDQMEKVLYNLISNAIKYTTNGGEIAVDLKTAGSNLEFTVKDTGPGIRPDMQERIFEPFNRLDNTDYRSHGFGLGLYISKDIVKLHKGEISVESEEGQGSSFHFKIPLESTSSKVNVESQVIHDEILYENLGTENGNEPSQSNLTILIVEDNQELREFLVNNIGEHYNTLEAIHGRDALDKAFEFIPDLIVSDVMMPEMDGIELTRNLKTDKRTSHIPVILLTARSSLIYKQEGYETGSDEYITKPFDKSLLLKRIENLIRNRNLVAEKIKTDILLAPKELTLNSKDEEFLNELKNVVELHIATEELSATFLSKELGMSHSVLYKKIKSLTGMTIVEFVRDFKLKTAAKMISELDYSVSEVSYKVGFSDAKYFSKVFKKKFGVNPSRFVENEV